MEILHDYSLGEIKNLIEEMGEKPFRAGQIFRGIHSGKKISEITDISKDFRNKLDFVWNILVQTFTSATIFYINEKDKPETYPYKALTRTFKNKEDAILCAELNKSVQALHFEKMASDDEYLESACVYEFYNHETPYDWDGLEPALNSLGLSQKTLTDRQKKIINRAYHKVVANGNW